MGSRYNTASLGKPGAESSQWIILPHFSLHLYWCQRLLLQHSWKWVKVGGKPVWEVNQRFMSFFFFPWGGEDIRHFGTHFAPRSCAVFSAWSIFRKEEICSSIYFVAEGLMVPITACGKPGVAVKIMNRSVHFCLQSHFMAYFRISSKSVGFIGSGWHSFLQDISSFVDGEVRFFLMTLNTDELFASDNWSSNIVLAIRNILWENLQMCNVCNRFALFISIHIYTI